MTADAGFLRRRRKGYAARRTRRPDRRAGADAVRTALTGRSANTLWEFTTFARDATGSALLVVDDVGHGYRVDLASGRHERFPFFGATPGEPPSVVAW
jgi:hypothetical protein